MKVMTFRTSMYDVSTLYVHREKIKTRLGYNKRDWGLKATGVTFILQT
jgi:hypothetical protein